MPDDFLLPLATSGKSPFLCQQMQVKSYRRNMDTQAIRDFPPCLRSSLSHTGNKPEYLHYAYSNRAVLPLGIGIILTEQAQPLHSSHVQLVSSTKQGDAFDNMRDAADPDLCTPPCLMSRAAATGIGSQVGMNHWRCMRQCNSVTLINLCRRLSCLPSSKTAWDEAEGGAC